MFDKRALSIAYYSAMGRYWLNKFTNDMSKESEAKVMFYLEKLVEAINE